LWHPIAENIANNLKITQKMIAYQTTFLEAVSATKLKKRNPRRSSMTMAGLPSLR
jgi:hypothetical protein